MQQHWSTEHEERARPKIRRTLFVEIVYTELGKATVICECGARAEVAVNAARPTRGRPPKPITAEQMAHEWAAKHMGERHASNEGWEVRSRYATREEMT